MKLLLVLFAATLQAATFKLLPATADSYPFGAAGHTRDQQDLRKIGYVEEEFLMTGTANVYDWPAPGPAVVRTANAPYTTRVLIRRPADRRKFSGRAVVEMLNPSNLFDLNIGWAMSGKQFVRNGDAWIGITAKPVAIAALKQFNPSRYEALSWANPDPNGCAPAARDSDRSTENGLIWDIHSQTGAWLRSGKSPLGEVKRVYAWGYSQTGSFLYTYVNAIHPLDVKANGKPIFDAYLIAVASGPAAIHQCAAPIPAGDPRRKIAAPGVPVIRVMSQSDYLRSAAARLPDSDDPPMRNYEIAGSGHATPDELSFAAAPEDIVKAGREVPPMDCNEGPRSRFPSRYAFNAILVALQAWVEKGVAPPRTEQIRIEDNKPVLDPFGNVTGGWRSPSIDVPVSTWFGNSTGKSFCGIAGHETAFDAARLKELYPTHAAYVDAVTRSVKSLVAQRFLVREDGDQIVADARAASIP